MWKSALLVVVSGCCTLSSFAQLKEYIHLKDDSRFKRVELNLVVKTGALYIRPAQNTDALKVYGNMGVQVDDRAMESKIAENTCFIDLSLGREEEKGVGQNISQRVFGTRSYRMDDLWNVQLMETKPYDLNITCGLGDASIDLSNLLVSRLKVKTGGADITTFYGSETGNKERMDTLLMQAEMGFINARQLNLARPKTVIAEVSFGGILLDFGGTLPPPGIHVVSSVGTGSLVIILPERGTPIKVHMKNSWLCGMNMHWSLLQISKNTFVNRAYLDKKPNPLTFDIDISMGTISFR